RAEDQPGIVSIADQAKIELFLERQHPWLVLGHHGQQAQHEEAGGDQRRIERQAVENALVGAKEDVAGYGHWRIRRDGDDRTIAVKGQAAALETAACLSQFTQTRAMAAASWSSRLPSSPATLVRPLPTMYTLNYSRRRCTCSGDKPE